MDSSTRRQDDGRLFPPWEALAEPFSGGDPPWSIFVSRSVGLQLKNPVLVASGTFGYVREMAGFVHLERLGGVIPKTVTFRPRAGNPTPRTVETASGLLNAIGLDNDGISHFREHHLPYLRTVGTAVIANIAGEDEDQFVAMAETARAGAWPGGRRAQRVLSQREPRPGPGNRRRRRSAGWSDGCRVPAPCRSSPS